jgi:16S rRNA (uracil1498-N3)-methyltransferase
MQLYFASSLTGPEIILEKDESHHLVHVVRKKAGDHLLLTDGKGRMMEAEIIKADAKACLLVPVADVKHHQHNYHLHIAIAPTKNIDRLEWFIEKAVETGINEITPVITARSERKTINADRLNKLMISAAKQSRKSLFPVLNPLVKFNDFITHQETGRRFIALCEDEMPFFSNSFMKQENVLVMIGPEGDFTAEENQKAIRSDFKGVSLGEYRLRTETAALMACTTVAIINQL